MPEENLVEEVKTETSPEAEIEKVKEFENLREVVTSALELDRKESKGSIIHPTMDRVEIITPVGEERKKAWLIGQIKSKVKELRKENLVGDQRYKVERELDELVDRL